MAKFDMILLGHLDGHNGVNRTIMHTNLSQERIERTLAWVNTEEE